MTRGELKDEIKSIISECMLEMNNNSDDLDNIYVEQECVAFVDNHFLNFVEESAISDREKINKILLKMKVGKDGTSKYGELTDNDINELMECIKRLADIDPVQARVLSKRILALLSIMLVSYVTGLTGIATFNSALTNAGFSLSIISGAVLNLINISIISKNGTTRSVINRAVFESYYNKMMKVEAKAKAGLKKINALEDDDKESKKSKKIEKLKSVIANCEKLRSQYKTIVNKIDNLDKSTSDKTGAFKECFVVTESGEVEFVQEMKGNQMKVELFKQIADDCDEILRARYDYLTDIDKNIHEALNVIKSVNNKEEAAKAIISLKEKLREFNAKNENNGMLKAQAFRNLSANAKKFTNKYAFESMQTKKQLAAKIEKYQSIIIKIGEKFDGETGSLNKEIYAAMDRLEMSDSFGDNSARMISQFEAIIESWQKGVVTMCNSTVKDCNKVLRFLKLGKEKSIVFKLLNRKERKAEKKAEKSE